MACTSLYPVIVSILVFSGVTGHSYGNFPLYDCDTGQFDILELSSRSTDSNSRQTSPDFQEDITKVWTEGNTNNSRVRTCKIYATREYNTYSCDVEVLRYEGQMKEVVNICSRAKFVSFHNATIQSVHADIEIKIKIAKSIFDYVYDERKNSTQVVVVTVDNSLYPVLTAAEINRIPDILHEDNSQMKVFIIVYHTKVDQILLRDTIITNNDITIQTASMALCNKCLPGWFSLKPEGLGDLTSCYKLEVSLTNVDWYEGSSKCTNMNGYLATIESKEELTGLQEQLFVHISANTEQVHTKSTVIYLGLKRDTTTITKQFQWEHPTGYRPVVINHWLPSNPNGMSSLSCGVWLFNGIFNYTVFVNNVLDNTSSDRSLFSDYKSINSEGWSSVGCGVPLSKLSLCEVTLSRFVKDKHDVTEQTTNDIDTHDLNSSEFQEFEGKIVSVSAYVNNEEFLRFLTKKNEEFPLFDCGDDGTQPRYISYSYVCDYIDHCKNGRDELECYASVNVNKCRSGQMLSSLAVCDMFKDCDDGSDEENCKHCRGRRCCDGTCLPSHMFEDEEFDCSECRTNENITAINESRSPEQSSFVNEKCAFICNTNRCIYPSQLNDGIVHCTGPEGPLDERLGKLENISCTNKLSRKVWAPRCVYLKDRYRYMLGCKDLSHLQNCSDFPCQEGYYKCPDRYCIPLHYVMDGINDCPAGEEEEYLLNHTCIGNFACWNSKVCLHPDLVCDGAAQCPHKDDELNCDVSCTKGVRCIAGTIILKNNALMLTQVDTLQISYSSARYIDISGLDLSRISGNSYISTSLAYDVRLSGCALKDVYDGFPLGAQFLKNVQRLDLSYNILTYFNENEFGSLHNLKLLNLSFNRNLNHFSVQRLEQLEIIDLSHTGLSFSSETGFVDLPKLKHLNLSHTLISTFHRHIFPSSFTLQTLDLRGSPIVKFFENTYNGLRITSALYTDNFGLCCPQVRGSGVHGYKCRAPGNAISSCFDLIGGELLRILFWLIASVAIIGNAVLTMYSLFWDTSALTMPYGLFVLNLGISDLIMGLYLLMIAVADVYYSGAYIMYDKDWKQSVVCKVAGFLATLSRETSAFFIFLIAVDRVLVLKYPYGQNKFKRMVAIIVIDLTWVIGFVLALFSVMPIFGHDSIFTSSPLCIGVPLTTQRLNGWGYSVAVFVVLNCIMFLLTALLQVEIFRSMSDNMNHNSLRQAHDITVTKQLSVLILNHLVLWSPIGLMCVLSVFDQEISNDVLAWTSLFIMPVNTAINPIICTIPIILERWKNSKKLKSSSQ